MRTKFFILNKDEKIEFTKEDLKKLLDEIYNEGYDDGRSKHYYYYSTPYRYTNPWYCTTYSSSDINLSTGSSSCDCKDKASYTYTIPKKEDKE